MTADALVDFGLVRPGPGLAGTHPSAVVLLSRGQAGSPAAQGLLPAGEVNRFAV